jgi:tetratricopeptide (TPR) repeat protein
MSALADLRLALSHTVEKITAERGAAYPAVERLRSADLDRLWDEELPASWRTAGFVQELTAAAADMLEKDARRSLELAQLAEAIITSIPSHAYPPTVFAQLEGNAWKEIGTAHRYLSEFDAALRAYDAAQRAFERSGTLGHDVAIVELARAVVLSELRKHDEALALIEESAPVFGSFGDQRRLTQAALLKGMIHQRRGNLQAARMTYEEVLAARPDEDLHTVAATYHNLGRVCADLGDSAAAVTALRRARDLFSGLEMSTEVTRNDWALAKILLATGSFIKALPMHRRVRADFLSRQMPAEAGLAALDLAEALMAMDHADEARVIAGQALDEFRAAKLNERAITALAYLRDLLPETSTPTRAIRYVRSYLAELQEEPARAFLPLEK